MSSDDFFRQKPALILTDSLGKFIGANYHGDVLPYPGLTIQKLDRLVNNLEIDTYKLVFVMVGTNNLTPKYVWDDYRNSIKTNSQPFPLLPHETTPRNTVILAYRHLISSLKRANPGIHIIISAILPRVFDYPQNREYIEEINHFIDLLCQQSHNCIYFKTFKYFMKYNAPKSDLFHKDGLHLSSKGNTLLRDIINCKVAETLVRI